MLMDRKKYDFEQLRLNDVFENAYQYALKLSTDNLLLELEKVEYKSFGFPAVMLYYMNEHWETGLRNEPLDAPIFRADGATPKQALEKLYAYCKWQKYF